MECFVYENWIHKKAIVHRADCSFCNDGKGVHDYPEYSERNGRWLGPYSTYGEAKTVAVGTKMKRVDDCKFCF